MPALLFCGFYTRSLLLIRSRSRWPMIQCMMKMCIMLLLWYTPVDHLLPCSTFRSINSGVPFISQHQLTDYVSGDTGFWWSMQWYVCPVIHTTQRLTCSSSWVNQLYILSLDIFHDYIMRTLYMLGHGAMQGMMIIYSLLFQNIFMFKLCHYIYWIYRISRYGPYYNFCKRRK